jgi:hypothetical protein
MNIISGLAGVPLLAAMLVFLGAPSGVRAQKAPQQTVQQSPADAAMDALRTLKSRPPTEQELEVRKRARQQYLKVMQEYQSEPERVLGVCEARAAREKMLRAENRMDELDSELIARHDDWKRENERLGKALKGEETPGMRSDAERLAEWRDYPDVARARYRAYLKTSATARAYEFLTQTMDSSCNLALSSIQCIIVGCGAADSPRSLPPVVDHSPVLAPKSPSLPIYTGPSEADALRDMEREAESERLRRLEQRQADLESQEKREKH